MTESRVAESPARPRRRRGDGMVVALLVVVLCFQATILPDTMGLKSISRIANALALLAFGLGGVYAMFGGRTRRAPAGYVVAVLLVVVGCSVNIARSLSADSLGAAGALLAWTAALSIPFFRSYDTERCWRLFYRFMLWGSVVGMIEYVAVMSGVLSTRPIETDRGVYLKAIFTLFYGLDDGSVHYRMYGLFAEPGTYAMYLLPAIAYAWFRGRYWAVALFLACLYCTDSLGGIGSLFVMLITYLFWRSRERPLGLLLLVGVSAAITLAAASTVRERYEEKGGSATVREENVTRFRDNFASIVAANPFGMPLTGKSLSELENVTNNYLGSNFEIYTLFVKGGVLACLGYTLLLVWCLVRNVRYLMAGNRDPRAAIALVCLPGMILFVVQRETVFASALFAFLFARPLLTLGRGPAAGEAFPRVAARMRRMKQRPPLLLADGS